MSFIHTYTFNCSNFEISNKTLRIDTNLSILDSAEHFPIQNEFNAESIFWSCHKKLFKDLFCVDFSDIK